jgi:hypothetical protein
MTISGAAICAPAFQCATSCGSRSTPRAAKLKFVDSNGETTTPAAALDLSAMDQFFSVQHMDLLGTVQNHRANGSSQIS